MAEKKAEELFKLMADNPDLPVVPMVDSEIVADDGYNRWIGSWGCAYIGEYIKGEECIYFRDDEDDYEIEKLVEEMLGADNCENMDFETYREIYRKAKWIKAIIVNIDLPD